MPLSCSPSPPLFPPAPQLGPQEGGSRPSLLNGLQTAVCDGEFTGELASGLQFGWSPLVSCSRAPMSRRRLFNALRRSKRLSSCHWSQLHNEFRNFARSPSNRGTWNGSRARRYSRPTLSNSHLATGGPMAKRCAGIACGSALVPYKIPDLWDRAAA